MAKIIDGGGIILGDEPEDIPWFQLTQWEFALKIQYDTGLKYSRGSVPKFVAQKFGMKYRTKNDIPALISECQRRKAVLEAKREARRYEEAAQSIKDAPDYLFTKEEAEGSPVKEYQVRRRARINSMNIDDATKAKLWAMKDDVEKQMRIAEGLLEKNPTLTPITAIIIAGDIQSKERADIVFEGGATFDEALGMVGSFARLDWAIEAQEKGWTTQEHLLDILPKLWRGSDPDDTNPKYLMLWTEAWKRNGKKAITDGKPLPRHRTLKIYRGQTDELSIGIAWSLNEEIAQKFAHGAGVRVATPGGVVYQASVRRVDVLAYLTGRGEEEVVVNPFYLTDY